MSATPWIIFTIIALLIIVGVLSWYIVKNRKKRCPPDYYSFFLMGLVWVPLGFIMKNNFLTAFGFILMIIGLLNKDKWKASRKCWGKIDKKTRQIVVALASLVGAFVFLGFVILYLLMQGYI